MIMGCDEPILSPLRGFFLRLFTQGLRRGLHFSPLRGWFAMVLAFGSVVIGVTAAQVAPSWAKAGKAETNRYHDSYAP